jgi:hypothetical protein
MEASEMANPATAGRAGRPAQKATPGKTAQKTAPPRTTARTTRQGTSSQQEAPHVHTAHPSVPIPYVTPRDVTAGVRAAGSKLSSMPPLPPPKRLAFYGGLGALAVFGAVDWPVAVAIGAATVVARSGRKENGDRRKST